MVNAPVHLLVISPHPSDPEFGIGGTVARWTKQGKTVVYVIATNGNKGSSDPDLKAEVLAKTREKEQKTAAKMLGVKEVIFLKHPDQGLEDEPGLRKEILKLILTYRPEIVATANPFNPPYLSNRDHRVLGRVVMDMVWPTALAPNNYRDLLAQGLKLHKVKELLLWSPGGDQNYRVDISDVFELKQKACLVHQSQIGPEGNPDFFDMLVASNKAIGKMQDWLAGEAFYRIDVLQRL